MRNRVIRRVDTGEPSKDRKLAFLCRLPLTGGSSAHALLKVTPRRARVEQFDFLEFVARLGVAELAKYNLGKAAGCRICRSKAAITCRLAVKLDNTVAVLIEDNDRDSEVKVLEVLAYAEEIIRERIVKEEFFDFLLDAFGCGLSAIAQAGAIADLGVEELTSGEGFVGLNEPDYIIRELVAATPGNIFLAVGGNASVEVAAVAKHLRGLRHEGHPGVQHRQQLDGKTIIEGLIHGERG